MHHFKFTAMVVLAFGLAGSAAWAADDAAKVGVVGALGLEASKAQPSSKVALVPSRLAYSIATRSAKLAA